MFIRFNTLLLIFSIIFRFEISAQTKEDGFIGSFKVYYGASYYPETWDVKDIDEDILRMKELNMNVMRMAEFSWSRMEPEEGLYDFKWLHEVIEKLHKNGIDVILGTPTATPPAWLWDKYPDIARVEEDGFVNIHGARRSTSYTNETYRSKCRQIVERMAMEFGHKPGVIGWQTDNEFNLAPDYSKETKTKWQLWLEKKYGTIQNLNKLWATDLWSQTYQSFQQIPMPVSKIWHHPSLRFEWERFTNNIIVEFQDIQLQAIRKHSALPITHDTMPGQRVNYEKLMQHVDYMSVNNYHGWQAYDRIVSNYDRMRGYGKGFHWLFETAPNYSGGGDLGNTWFLHEPSGALHAAIWLNYALGGQGAMYWLWKQHKAGQEMVHGSIVSAWNKPAANYQDIKKLGEDLKKSSEFLMNNPVAPASAAIMYSHQAESGFRIENYVNGIRYYMDWTYRFYLPFQDAYLHRDVISADSDIDQYKLISIPLMPYIPDQLRKKLKTWVQSGGTLLLGPMSGYRTDIWTFYTDHALGDFEDWMGIEVDSRVPLALNGKDAGVPVHLKWHQSGFEQNNIASLWSEALSSKKGTVICSYDNGAHKDKPAIIEAKSGKGKVVLLGTDPGRDAMTNLIMQYAKDLNIIPLASGDAGAVVVPRGNKEKGFVIINISNSDKNIKISEGSYYNLLTGEKESSHIELAPFQVKVLKK